MNAIGRRAELACRLAEMRRFGEQITRNPISTPSVTTTQIKFLSIGMLSIDMSETSSSVA